MRKIDLIGRLARSIATYEGWYVTERQAREQGIKYPTRAQRNCNPGNVRCWDAYPRSGGYVDFLAWAEKKYPKDVSRDYITKKAIEEGWRVLTVLVERYIDGVFTEGRSPTLYEMFALYAPASDGNAPRKYAEFVARELGIPPDKPLSEVVDA